MLLCWGQTGAETAECIWHSYACFLFTVLFSYAVLTSLWVGVGIFGWYLCAWFQASSLGINTNTQCILFLTAELTFQKKCSQNCISTTHVVWNVCLWNMLGYSYKETNNIRLRLCGVLCHWRWRMWHIEDKQTFPQTKIWGKPTFVFSSCLWNNHTVIVFRSLWITALWEDFLALSIIVHFSVKGLPGNTVGLCWRSNSFSDFWMSIIILVSKEEYVCTVVATSL